MSPSLKRWSATVCCALGIGLSLHLGLLKLFALPCVGPGGCHSIIHSGYGSVLGIPVGFYGALLWAAAILVSDQTKRGALLVLLAAGSAIFMGLQFVVLKGFCLYCTAHAVVSWLALAFMGEAPRRSSALLGIALAIAGFWVARAQAASAAERPLPAPDSGVPLAAAPAGVSWLGPLTPRSPALVLSLNCAACVDLLEELTRRSYREVHSGPALFFKTTDENRELTTVFVASVLAQPGSKRDAFLASTTLLLTIKDQALSAPGGAAVQLAGLTPASAGHREQATRLLEAQAATLRAQGLGETTPLLVPIHARSRAFFRVEELFP